MDIHTINPQTKKALKLDVNTAVASTRITIAFSDKTTIAVTDVDTVRGIGIAKCMPGDKYSKDVGAGIAAARALKHIAEQMEETWNSRSITKEEWAKKHNKKGQG